MRAYRRTQEVFIPGQGRVDLRPVIRYGKYSYLVCIPPNWVGTFCDSEDIRVTVESLEGEPGFIIRPFRGSPPVNQGTLPLPGL